MNNDSKEALPSGDVDNREKHNLINSGKTESFVQYTTIDGKYYRPASKTIGKMPPGIYRLFLDNNGTIVYSKESVVTDDLISFPDSKNSMILKEIELFWTLKDKFKKLGFIHKRGFLLWGPPGGGKSCTVAQISRSMIEKQDGLVFISQTPQVLEEAMRVIRQVEPNRKILVILEDIDDILMHGNEHHLLNLLDGANQVDNVVYIATTNYPSKLPPRLINRPSRFDKIVKIGYPSEEARKIYIVSKIGEHTTEENGQLIDLAKKTDGFTFAHLRDLIVSVFCLGMKVDKTIERLKAMKFTPKDEDDSGRKMGIGQDDYDSTDGEADGQ